MKTKTNYFFLIFLPSPPKWVVKMPKMVFHPINLKKIPCPKQRTHTFVTCRVKKQATKVRKE